MKKCDTAGTRYFKALPSIHVYKVSDPNFDSPQLFPYLIFVAQIFRIVRAVPETLNSGAFLFKKNVFGNSKFSKCQEIFKI